MKLQGSGIFFRALQFEKSLCLSILLKGSDWENPPLAVHECNFSVTYMQRKKWVKRIFVISIDF